MPLLTLRSTVAIDEAAAARLLRACSAALAERLGQPEDYVMTMVDRPLRMTMAGTADPACLAEVRSVVPFSSEQTQAVTRTVCALLAEHLAVPPDRVFVNFTHVPTTMWGFNGSTLA